MKAFFVSMLLFFLFNGCKTRRLVVSDVDGPRIELKFNSKTPEELFGVWMNAYEEEKLNGESVYRPQNYDFQLSRGRSGIEFLPNGTFYEIFPGPTDAYAKIEGNWIYSAKTRSIDITFPEKNTVSSSTKIQVNPKPYTLLLLSISKEVLKIKKLDD